MKRRVVITGMGAVTPIGNNVDQLWQNAKSGICGIDKITNFDTSNHKVKMAGKVKNLNPENFIDKKELRKMHKFTYFALIAAMEAVAMSKIEFQQEDTNRCGTIISSGIGGLEVIENEHSKGLEKGFDRVSPFFIPMSIINMASGAVAIRFGLKGSCSSFVTACASATNAIGEAMRSIMDGYNDVMVCGGTESSITPLGIGGFTSMKALSESEDKTRASIPFDKERNGFVMGEGAGILILEEYEHAKRRNANIICEITGYGSTCDAYHMTAPDPSGDGAARCMISAVNESNITVDKIDYINAHGTSTPMNDKCETKAIKTAFGEHAYKLSVSSTKSMTGHLLGASGAVEAIITALTIKNDFICPTVNYKVKDEDCDLDITPNFGKNRTVDYALSNSLGFGGHNASILLKKYSV